MALVPSSAFFYNCYQPKRLYGNASISKYLLYYIISGNKSCLTRYPVLNWYNFLKTFEIIFDLHLQNAFRQNVTFDK